MDFRWIIAGLVLSVILVGYGIYFHIDNMTWIGISIYAWVSGYLCGSRVMLDKLVASQTRTLNILNESISFLETLSVYSAVVETNAESDTHVH